MAQTIHIYGPESGVASHAALRSSNVIILNVLFRKPINFHFLGQGGGVPILIILLTQVIPSSKSQYQDSGPREY